MNAIQKVVLTITATTIVAADAHAGRWLSRDPIEEGAGFVQRDPMPELEPILETRDEPYLHVLVGNDATLIGLNTAGVIFQEDDPAGTELRDAIRAGDLSLYGFTKNDPIDNIDAFGLTVYIQAHPVVAGFNHSKVTMVVECGSRWMGDSRFHPMPGQSGQYYATIGAGPIHHLLVSGVNRPRDVQLWRNIFSARVPPPAGTSEDDFIGQLFTANSRYPNNLPYAWFPTRHGRHYNSNGYASGILLFVTGSMPPRPPKTPGFRHPVPAPDFQ
ncbi:exported hypothetical protein [Candidatus Sulfotelmatobacter kueseliae]|uniref:Uncharacterized protein n=1 Tax=Candidatus Sulfotelmatobacter kueseliae TaxID=2042962 RepID=A0A2U3KAH6_9BACT|nr:exported hypothetical protein [Candidatus Sulfotelmatobacter kueseliae]